MEEIKLENKGYMEKELTGHGGWRMVIFLVLMLLASIAAIILSSFWLETAATTPEFFGSIFLLVVAILAITAEGIMCAGFKVVSPKEAMVLVLFGEYIGTLKTEGFYWVNPFCQSVNPSENDPSFAAPGQIRISGSGTKKISLKTMTLNNEKQTVNDERGNPIIIGTIVIWHVTDTAKAAFHVDNFKTFLSIQCDSAIRNVSRLYPYDVSDGSDEKTLRGSSQEVANMLQKDLQTRVNAAGLDIMEVRITHLSYAPEIAAVMLQRQQAEAIIAARQKIVEGAVGMVEMALSKLGENDIVRLDDERKAAMVSNLLVVLCGNRDAQPVVNSGSIY